MNLSRVGQLIFAFLFAAAQDCVAESTISRAFHETEEGKSLTVNTLRTAD
jgi:hypothetical protein